MVRSLLTLFVVLFGVCAASAQVQSIGIAGDGEFTRITISSDHALAPDIFTMRSENGRTFQLVPEHFSLAENAYLGEPTGGIDAYTLDTDRIIFELQMPMMIVRELDLPPTGSETRHRFILDLSRVSEARFDESAKRDAKRFARINLPQAELPVTQAQPATPPNIKPWGLGEAIKTVQARRYTVVIDAGHGGRDPGALSVLGGKESDIVLKTALTLKEELQKDPRYEVRLTRETDVYIEHEDRVSMARDWGADLFISLHADAAAKPDISGASVYTISTTGERRIEGAANKYGWHLPIEDGTTEEVSGILEDLIKRETKSNSTVFAEFLVPELAQAGPLLRNTHRQKNLFVLLAPDVPAVLIEIGFITNKSDARRLKTSRGRQKSAKAIKRAIDAYFDRQDLRLATN